MVVGSASITTDGGFLHIQGAGRGEVCGGGGGGGGERMKLNKDKRLREQRQWSSYRNFVSRLRRGPGM